MLDKKSKKNKKNLYKISVAVFIYIFCLSIGYAFFSDSLTINGVASTVDYYSGTALPTTPIIRDTELNRYYTYDNHKDWVDFESESWEGDTYTLVYKKKAGIVIGEKTVNYTVSFTNPTAVTYTDGTIETEIIENNNGRIKEVSASLSKTEVAPGETVDVTFTVTFNFLTEIGQHKVKATATYMLQNKPRIFNFIIHYDT